MTVPIYNKTSLFKENDSLINFIFQHISNFAEGSILVITSKIVALGEGRVCSIHEKEKCIHGEAQKTLKTPWATMTQMCPMGGESMQELMNQTRVNPLFYYLRIHLNQHHDFALR